MFLLRGSNQNPTRHCVAAGIPSRSTERFQRMGDLRGMPINFGMRKLQSWEGTSLIKHLQPTSKQFESWDENEHEKNHKAVKSKHEPTSKHCKTLFQRHPCVNVCHRNEMMLKRTMDNVKHGEVKHAANQPGKQRKAFIEGSLEVKLPTIWTDGKAEVGRVREEKSRRKKIREEKE